MDRTVNIIKALGFTNFAVNAGGDLTVMGERDGELWQVAIRHPRDLNKNYSPITDLKWHGGDLSR